MVDPKSSSVITSSRQGENDAARSSRTRSIEEYERRFLNSLEKLNANIPEWLVVKQKQYQQQMQQQKQQQQQHHYYQGSKLVSSSSGSNSNWSTSNTKSRYDRIRQKARQQLNITNRAYGTDAATAKLNDENKVNSKSLVLLTVGNHNQANGSSKSMNHKSNEDLIGSSSSNRPLSAYATSSNHYSSSYSIPRPLSVSSNSLNTNWYKPKTLHLPSRSVSCGDGLRNPMPPSSSVSAHDIKSHSNNLSNLDIRKTVVESMTHQELSYSYSTTKTTQSTVNKEINNTLHNDEKQPVTTKSISKLNNSSSSAAASLSNIQVSVKYKQPEELYESSTHIVNNNTTCSIMSSIDSNPSSKRIKISAADLASSTHSSSSSGSTTATNSPAYSVTTVKQIPINKLPPKESYDTHSTRPQQHSMDDDITCPISNFENDEEDEDINEFNQDDINEINMIDKMTTTTTKKLIDVMDFQNKFSSETFIISSSNTHINATSSLNQAAAVSTGSGHNLNADSSAFNLSGISFNKSEDFEEDTGELRHYDEEFLQRMQQKEQPSQEEDEFFLISTPSPFNLASLATARTGQNPQAFQLIEQNDDEDKNNFGDQNYSYQLDSNRLSNITEEEDESISSARDSSLAQHHKSLSPRPLLPTTSTDSAINTTTNSTNIIYQNEANLRVKLQQNKPSSVLQSLYSNGESSEETSDEKKQIGSYNEMLKLSEDCMSRFEKINAELSNPTAATSSTSGVNYVPVMKKRVYKLNGAYLNNNSDDNPLNPLASSSLTNTDEPPRDAVYTLKHEETMKEAEPSSSSDNILNYLITRLSEQHKGKIDVSSSKKMPDTDSFEQRFNKNFDDIEQRLISKYAGGGKPDSESITESGEQTVPTAQPTSYILTKSVYANHKKIKVGNDDNRSDVIQTQSESIAQDLHNNNVITALSINEIEMRKSFVDDSFESIGYDQSSPLPPSTALVKKAPVDDEIKSKASETTRDERKIKEEIVLIGERNDIESLLENQNNQLFNLILSNSRQAKRVADIESDLSEKRLIQLKEKPTRAIKNDRNSLERRLADEDDDIEIEIRYQDEEELSEKEKYEAELKQVAKYLVDEITKISLNKVKIDALNETLDKSYLLSSNFEGASERILTSMMDDDIAPQAKSKEELLEYYTKLETNLQQVRNEIEQLKKEAFEDMAYINQILGSAGQAGEEADEETPESLSRNPELIDYDQVYLKADDEEVMEAKEDQDEDTQYLSQINPVSATSFTVSSRSQNPANVGLSRNDYSSQVYVTPEESWRTLIHDDSRARPASILKQSQDIGQVVVTTTTVTNDEEIAAPENDGNQTELDEDQSLEENIANRNQLNLAKSEEMLSSSFYSINETTKCVTEEEEEEDENGCKRSSLTKKIIESTTTMTVYEQHNVISRQVMSVNSRPSVVVQPIEQSQPTILPINCTLTKSQTTSFTGSISNEVIKPTNQRPPTAIRSSMRSDSNYEMNSPDLASSQAVVNDSLPPKMTTSTVRSRSTGPPLANPRLTIHNPEANNNNTKYSSSIMPNSSSTTMLNKEAVEKFVRQATACNSASLLNLSQPAHQPPNRQTSGGSVAKTSSSNLLTLCGVESYSPHLSSSGDSPTSSVVHSSSSRGAASESTKHKSSLTNISKPPISTPVIINNGSSTIGNKNSEKVNRLPPPFQKSNTIGNINLRPTQSPPEPPVQQRPSVPETNRPSRSTAIKPTNFESQLESILTSNRQSKPVSMSPAQMLFESNVAGSASNPAAQRIPSSRHFCGRLMSTATYASNNSSNSNNMNHPNEYEDESSGEDNHNNRSTSSPTSSSFNSQQHSSSSSKSSTSSSSSSTSSATQSSSDNEEMSLDENKKPAILTINSSGQKIEKINRSSASTLTSSPPSTASSSPRSASSHQARTPQTVQAPSQQHSPSGNLSCSTENIHVKSNSNSMKQSFTNTAIYNQNNLINRIDTVQSGNKSYNQPIIMNSNRGNTKSVEHLLNDNGGQSGQMKSSMMNSGNQALPSHPTLKKDSINALMRSQKDISTSATMMSPYMASSTLNRNYNNNTATTMTTTTTTTTTTTEQALSKSIRDLKLYVSNSYSPSLIIRPPPTSAKSTSNLLGNGQDEYEDHSSMPVEIDDQKENEDARSKSSTSTSRYSNQAGPVARQPVVKQQPIIQKTAANNKEKPLIHTNLHTYKTLLNQPLKDERSDQVRVEFIRQQQMLAKMQKLELKEYLKHKDGYLQSPPYVASQQRVINTQQQAISNSKPTSNSGNKMMGMMGYSNQDNGAGENDLINCILEMKSPNNSLSPASSMNSEKYVNRSRPTHFANIHPPTMTSTPQPKAMTHSAQPPPTNRSVPNLKSRPTQAENLMPVSSTPMKTSPTASFTLNLGLSDKQKMSTFKTSLPPSRVNCLSSGSLSTKPRVKRETNL